MLSTAETPLMALQDIVMLYGETRALDKASLRIFPGEVHALMVVMVQESQRSSM